PGFWPAGTLRLSACAESSGGSALPSCRGGAHTATHRGRTAAHRSEYAGYVPYGSAGGLFPVKHPTWRPFPPRIYRFPPAPRAAVPAARPLSAADTPAAG